MTDAEIRRAMRYLLCGSCGTLHLGTPAATTELCANCGGSKFRLASVEMVTQPIPSVRWPRPFSAEDIEKIERAARGAKQYLNALSFEERQDFLVSFSSLAIEGNRLAEVCYGTLRRLVDGAPVSDRDLLGLAREIQSIRERGAKR